MSVDWTNFDYENEIKINLDSLELNNQDNPELIMKYAKEKTKVSKDLRDKKEEMAVYEAKLRITTINLANKKMTVSEVDAEIKIDDKYQKLVAEINVLEYDLELLKECINVFRARSDSLREERELLALGYWATTSKTQGVRKVQLEKADEETRNAVNQRRRK
ncbi:hypothetical protein A2619_02270 [candidate division WWE3 bacterium RIFOXYD1_FULL_39_9]|uniref:Uncharacterized protein n=1 Tax=candidate division WWE3 bacterium RIFOXYD1_FULL_39_9 TaxID=1802649 RepID=A0A1F4X3K5_UNCKA|nr:MAG: hypothetical protein A2619_02270 [candidate division WWE3 bacterium RIFOXYD1_FULL_39_9]